MASRTLRTSVADSISDGWELSLPSVDGKRQSLSSLAGARATVVIFIGNGCPTARAYESRLMALKTRYEDDGIRLVAVNANNPHLSPPDTLAEIVKRAGERKIRFPYLKDEEGAVAKAFGAVCTPHAFVVDSEMRILYSGRIDDSRMGDRIASKDLENALEDIVAGHPVGVSRTNPFGCAIVW
jgi:peroxiredoxin